MKYIFGMTTASQKKVLEKLGNEDVLFVVGWGRHYRYLAAQALQLKGSMYETSEQLLIMSNYYVKRKM